MNTLRVWAKAVRAPFFTATLVPVALGTAIAWSEVKSFNFLIFFMGLLAAVMIQAGTNLVNDYFDHKSGNDWGNITPTPFSGGSRVIQDGLLRPLLIIKGAIVLYVIAFIIGAYLSWHIGNGYILILGLIGICIGVAYTASPFALSYKGHGLGELAVGLGFGPMMVGGAYFIQARQITAVPLFASVPVTILIILVLLINEFPDHKADSKAGKFTLRVVLGERKAALLYSALLFFAYFCIPALVLFGQAPIYSFVTFLTLPLAYKVLTVIYGQNKDMSEFIIANATTVTVHLVFGAILSLSYLWR